MGGLNIVIRLSVHMPRQISWIKASKSGGSECKYSFFYLSY
jgi:hypothetical protein